MPQQQYGLAAAAVGKIHLQMIAGLRLRMDLHLAAQAPKLIRQVFAQCVASLLVVRGRFSNHEFADGGHHLGLPLIKPLRFVSAQGQMQFSVACCCCHRNSHVTEWRSLRNSRNRGMYNLRFHDVTMNDQANPAPEKIDIGGLLKLLPHRYPMLLIDRVVEIVRAKRIVAIKNVTINEPFFQGHFPGYPHHAGRVDGGSHGAGRRARCCFTEVPDRDDKLLVFTGIERARFRRPVMPGDQLRIEVEVLAFRGTAGRLQGKAFVESKLVCEAVVTCRLLTRQPDGTATAAQREPAGEALTQA